ncbi:MAG: hypothetical protein AAF193_09465 [Bacteroidota bacterium]
MKCLLSLVLGLAALSAYSQDLETETLWRTRGTYDHAGKFMESQKLQIFLYITDSYEICRLRLEDQLNWETGEMRVFSKIDTLQLEPNEHDVESSVNRKQLEIVTSDSICIHQGEFMVVYVKLASKDIKMIQNEVEFAVYNLNLIETVEEESKYELMYQKNGVIYIKDIESGRSWESVYQFINFYGYFILQGTVSPSKVLTEIKDDSIHFLEVDYRFCIKHGTMDYIR